MSTETVSDNFPFQYFAKEFSDSAKKGRVYGVGEIMKLVGLPQPKDLNEDHVPDIANFEIAFDTFRRAMVDPVSPTVPYRKSAVVVRDVDSLGQNVDHFGLARYASGLFVSPNMMRESVARFNKIIRGINIEDEASFAQGMQYSLINAAVAEGVPVIFPSEEMEGDMTAMLLRLQAAGYDIHHKSSLPQPEAAPAVPTR